MAEQDLPAPTGQIRLPGAPGLACDGWDACAMHAHALSYHLAQMKAQGFQDGAVSLWAYNRRGEALHEARSDMAAMTDVLHRNGFVRCDIAACNCGSWHARFGLPERFREVKDALEEHGVDLNGKTVLAGLKEVLSDLAAMRAERDASLAEVERLREALSIAQTYVCGEGTQVEIDIVFAALSPAAQAANQGGAATIVRAEPWLKASEVRDRVERGE